MVLEPIARMESRASRARDESDAIYFHDLMYLGESMLKLITAEIVASLDDDRLMQRYALEYQLVRADSIGEWQRLLYEALLGPPRLLMVESALDSQRALTETFKATEPSWQRRVHDNLLRAAAVFDEKRLEGLTGKASMKHWTETFVWLRNRTRGHGAPSPDKLARACQFLEESLSGISANYPGFDRPWAHLRQGLSGKYRVTSFGGVREPFSYLTREAGHKLEDGVYVFFDRPRRCGLVFSDPDIKDFYSPNGNYRNSRFEVLSYITDDQLTLDGSAYTIPASSRVLSETAGRRELDAIGNVFTNMPPKRDQYVPRQALEAELYSVLTDDRHPVVTLHGRGGIGKTSLALEVLHRLARSDDFEFIVWASARDIDLLSEGHRTVQADVLSIEDMASEFVRLMGHEGRGGESQGYLKDCLSGKTNDGPFVFVVDNFETVRGQAEVYAFLSNVVRLPNKVLVTTRTREFKADYPIQVGGMERSEFVALCDATADLLGIQDLVTPRFLESLFEDTAGHPYILKVLLGEVARTRKLTSLKQIVANRDGMLDALFERSYAGLSLGAQRVFLTLTSWNSAIPRLGLEAVMFRQNSEVVDVEETVDELERSSLIERVTGAAWAEEFLTVPLAALLFGRRKLVTSEHRLQVEADIKLLKDFGATSRGEVPKGLYPRVQRLAQATEHRLARGEGVEQHLRVLEYIATDFPPARLALADLYQSIDGDAERATNSVSQFIEANPDDREGWERLLALRRFTGDRLGEVSALMELGRISGTIDRYSEAANRVNSWLHNDSLNLAVEERALLLGQLREQLVAHISEAGGDDYSRLVWLLLNSGDQELARDWLAEGLRVAPQNRHLLQLETKLKDL